MTEQQGYITTRDGVRLFFRKLGGGTETVVIPNATYMFEDFKYLAGDRTLITYDLRNRGRSDAVLDLATLQQGVLNDVDDLETVRAHSEIPVVDVLGHSYVGLVVALYAMKYPAHVSRVVQIAPAQPFSDKRYAAHLTGSDTTMTEISAKMAELQKEGPGNDPAVFASRLWSLMKQLYVTSPADADKIHWSVADLPNETLPNVMKYFNESLFPSIQRLQFTSDDFERVQMPVLIIHGTRDRHASYGGGREWALQLPNARLVTIEDAAHLPWIEDPDKVFASVRAFLDGDWPFDAERVASIDPNDPIELLYGGMTKLGPGSDVDTLNVLQQLPADSIEVIVDAGSGAGRQTLVLAKELRQGIQAVDSHEPFLRDLNKRAKTAGLDHLIKTHAMDMKDIPGEFQNIDLLWSEGAAYNMGFADALRTWAGAIKPGGFLVVSELSWLTEQVGNAARNFFSTAYPAMRSVPENIQIAETAGYRLLHTHMLAPETWVEDYYEVLEPRAKSLLNHSSAAVRNAAAETLQEIDVFRHSEGSYGYVFYVLQRA